MCLCTVTISFLVSKLILRFFSFVCSGTFLLRSFVKINLLEEPAGLLLTCFLFEVFVIVYIHELIFTKVLACFIFNLRGFKP